MKRSIVFVALALGVVWSCSEEEKPPPKGSPRPPDAGDGGTAGSSTGGSTVGGTSTGGAPDPGGGQGGESSGTGGSSGTEQGGAAGDGPGPGGGGAGGGVVLPCPSDSDPGEPPTSATVCDPTAMLGAPTTVTLEQSGGTLVAVTPDELTIVWTESTLMGSIYRFADRALPDDPFVTGGELEPLGYMALSPDGLRLMAVSGNGQSLVELVRTARSTAFGASGEGSFTLLNAEAMDGGLTFGGCIVSADDRTLHYVAWDGSSEHVLFVSQRTGTGPWPVGTLIEACEFQPLGGSFRQPTGISADGLTLFFYDWPRRVARAAWRESANGPFVWFQDLGSLDRPQPNTACDRLYSTVPGGPGYSELE